MRDLMSLVPFRRAEKGGTFSYQPSEFADELRKMTAAEPEPTVAEVNANWQRLYAEQTELVDGLCAQLSEALEIADQARNLMRVLALRGPGGIPLFTVNEAANQLEQATLQHAVLALQARLAGEPVPEMVTFGVKH